MRRIAFFVCLALIATCVPLAAQSLIGSIEGTVKDEQGGVLPGATVTLIGKTGSRTTATDSEGSYRFPALDPGRYEVLVELSGFGTQRVADVVVSIAKQARVNFQLKIAAIQETVEVVYESPVVDVSSSETTTELSQDILYNLPISRANAATGTLNYLPGINSESAMGGDNTTGNALMLDGVDTRDPSGNSAWTFFNFNIIEEIQVSGLGANAEYGGYTGAVINTITRSGGNQFRGLFDLNWTKGSFASDNIKPEYVEQNPGLASADVTNKLLDYTTQFSGPLMRDKLFFFASVQRYEIESDPSGPRTLRREVSPRFNTKLTWQPSPNDNVSFTFQYDQYNHIGREVWGADISTDDLTVEQDSPEYIWGLNYRRLFGSHTFFEVKYTGWRGYYDLNPKLKDTPYVVDIGSGEVSGGAGWFGYFDRGRDQVNASITHYAEAFGHHDIKFGVEVERATVRDRAGYLPNGLYYANYYGVPYYAYSYGYDVESQNQRESFFAQDSWKPSERLTINGGVRLDLIRGYPRGNSAQGPNGDSKVYDVKSWAPRIGFAYDLGGEGKTVFKGFYGQYYDGASQAPYWRALRGTDDFVIYAWDGQTVGEELDRFPASEPYRVDPNIKHPRVDEFTLGFERALTNDFRLAVTGIYRETKNFTYPVLPSARWAPSTVTNGLTGQPLTVYTWVNRSESEADGLITNPDGFRYLDADGNLLGTARAERKYQGLMFVLSKRLSNRWQAQVSYVLSKTEGTLDNRGHTVSAYARRDFETPSLALVNTDGRPVNDRPHEVKVLATYQVPVIDVNLSGYYRWMSGRTYEAYARFGSSEINFPSSSGREPLLEPRGSRRLDAENLLDLRVEKVIKLGAGRGQLGFYVDIINVFNASTVTDAITRYPSLSGVDFEAPSEVTPARQFTLSARYSF